MARANLRQMPMTVDPQRLHVIKEAPVTAAIEKTGGRILRYSIQIVNGFFIPYDKSIFWAVTLQSARRKAARELRYYKRGDARRQRVRTYVPTRLFGI
jgi:hypothetical protein